jgi:hypothetical protein
VDNDYVKIPTEDWLKIVEVLGNMSHEWDVTEEQMIDYQPFRKENVH